MKIALAAVALAVATGAALPAECLGAGNGDFPLPSLGACAHVATADFADRAQVFAMMREAGLGCVRTDLGWRICQPKPGAPLDFSRYDRLFEAAEAEGVMVLPILNWLPSWAKPITEHLDEWRAFVRAAAERYRGRVVAWEVWNEPNLRPWYPHGDVAVYVAMLRVANEELRAVDPGVPICSGGPVRGACRRCAGRRGLSLLRSVSVGDP